MEVKLSYRPSCPFVSWLVGQRKKNKKRRKSCFGEHNLAPESFWFVKKANRIIPALRAHFAGHRDLLVTGFTIFSHHPRILRHRLVNSEIGCVDRNILFGITVVVSRESEKKTSKIMVEFISYICRITTYYIDRLGKLVCVTV